jgi:hypothetical protein
MPFVVSARGIPSRRMEASGDHRKSPGHARDGERRPHTAPGAGDAGPEQKADLRLRNSPALLGHLGGQLGWHSRTAEVNDELAKQLAYLDPAEWLIVRGLPVRSIPIPFMLFGPTGLFLLQASRGYWIDEDVAVMSRAAAGADIVLRDYPGRTRPCIVILGGGGQERHYFTGLGEGPCWIVSEDRLLPSLLRFADHGFSAGDIRRLRESSNPARIRETRRDATPRGPGHAPGTRPEDWYFPG